MNLQRIVILSLLFGNSACTYTCKEGQDEFLKLTACNIVINEDRSMGRNIDIEGYNPNTNSHVSYDETGGLLIYVYKSINLGDTLFKPENSDWFLLKKKEFNIRFYAECGDNGEYLGIKQDTISKYNK